MEEVKFDELNLDNGPRIPKFKFMREEATYKKRIFFLPKLYKDTAHLKEGFGYSACLTGKKTEDNPEGICPFCQAGLSAGIKTVTRFGMHLLVYATSPDGALKSPFGYDIMAFVKNESQFKKVDALHKQYKDEMFKHDFLVSCSSTDFQNLDYSIDFECVWKKMPTAKETLEDIKKKIAEFPLNKIIAPEVSLKTMQDIINGKIPPRYTKNQSAPAGQPDPHMEFPPKNAAPYVPVPAAGVSVVVAPAPSVGMATKSDLDMLDELSKI